MNGNQMNVVGVMVACALAGSSTSAEAVNKGVDSHTAVVMVMNKAMHKIADAHSEQCFIKFPMDETLMGCEHTTYRHQSL